MGSGIGITPPSRPSGMQVCCAEESAGVHQDAPAARSPDGRLRVFSHLFESDGMAWKSNLPGSSGHPFESRVALLPPSSRHSARFRSAPPPLSRSPVPKPVGGKALMYIRMAQKIEGCATPIAIDRQPARRSWSGVASSCRAILCLFRALPDAGGRAVPVRSDTPQGDSSVKRRSALSARKCSGTRRGL